MSNTIVGDQFLGVDCRLGEAITSLGYNLDSDGTCGLSGNGDISDADPLIGQIQDNGGPTWTHALLTNSPAIDAIPLTDCLVNTDQRGILRPQGLGCDIGAYELVPAHEIQLNKGWNMISSYIDPENPNMEDVFAPIVDDIVLVKNDAGKVYWPRFSINSIGDWNINEGYMVYVRSDQILTMAGNLVIPEDNPLYLNHGWNMISYLRTNPMPIETALADLNNTVVLVINNAGKVYWPKYSINDIGDMIPGQGYKVFLSAADTLIYPSNAE
jgi:hypothetical protein